MEGEERLTPHDVALIIRDGHPALAANISRVALKQVVEAWEGHPRKAAQLESIRNSPINHDKVMPRPEYGSDGEYVLKPAQPAKFINMLPGVETPPGLTEFSNDYYNQHLQLYNELLSDSSLTKMQFLCFMLGEAGQTGVQIAADLDIAVGTVRSHISRARKKLETAKATVRLSDMLEFEGYDILNNTLENYMSPDGSPA